MMLFSELSICFSSLSDLTHALNVLHKERIFTSIYSLNFSILKIFFIPLILSRLVSATFAASLVTSPAFGAWIETNYGDESVVALATAVAILDVFFIMVAVPESLPEKCRPSRYAFFSLLLIYFL